MIIQKIESSRLFAAFFVQLIVAFIFLIIAFLLLKRKRSRLSITASLFYITLAISFLVNPFYLLILSNPTVYILYFITIYLMLLSPIFTLTFLMTLMRSKFEFSEKRQLLIYFIYGVLLFCILAFVPKITIDETTDWRPIWDFPLFLSVVILMIIVTIECYIYLVKIWVSFKTAELRKKWFRFLLGFIIFTFILYGFLIYCVWDNILYRIAWTYVSIALILGAILMYFAFGQSAQKEE